ncbi:MAG: hypothetical protein ACYTCN_07010, partial [Planctomycetota bacterium]
SLAEETKKQHAELLKQAQQRRIEAIDKAVEQARQDGTSKADEITQAGSVEIAALNESASAKIPGCIEKVLSSLRQTT